MRLDQNPLHLEHSGLSQATEFTLKASAQAFKILSQTLYPDPVLAVIRELICNAHDAHTRAGKPNTPIHVHLPTSMDMELRIKDEGTGISHHGMLNEYCRVFESDKNESNLEIGGLGLGRMATFSVTDQFHLRSIFMGVAQRYTAYVGTNGKPAVAPVGPSENTEEPDGFEVIVPISPEHRHAFGDRYARFIQTMPVHPISNFHEHVAPLETLMSRQIGEYRVEILSNAHASRHEYGSPIIIMGIVPYTITGSQKYDLPEIFRDRGVIIHAPISAFEVTPSREALSLKPADFVRLHTLADAFIGTLQPFFQEQISQAENALDLSTKHHELLRAPTLAKLYDHTLGSRPMLWRGYDVVDYIASNSVLEVPINGFNVNHLNTRIQRGGGIRMERQPKIYNTWNGRTLRPQHIFYAEKNRPYRHMLDLDLLSKDDSIWVLTGDLAAIERWLRMYGLWDSAEAVTKAPPKVRDPSSPVAARESFGSFEYTTRQFVENGHARDERICVAALENLAESETSILMAGEMVPGLEAFLKPGFRLFCVEIPDSHSKVQRHFAANIATYDNWVDFVRAHANLDRVLDGLSYGKVDAHINNSPALMAVGYRINRWSQWNTWEVDWLRSPEHDKKAHAFDEPLQTFSERATGFERLINLARQLQTPAHNLRTLMTNAWPDLDERVIGNDRQWSSYMSCLERDMQSLHRIAPALFQNNDRNTPPELINAYLKEVRNGQ